MLFTLILTRLLTLVKDKMMNYKNGQVLSDVDQELSLLLDFRGCDQWQKVQLKARQGGVTQAQTLGPILFNIFIEDLDNGAECILREHAGHVKPGGVPDKTEGCVALQWNLNRLEE